MSSFTRKRFVNGDYICFELVRTSFNRVDKLPRIHAEKDTALLARKQE